MIRLLPLVLVLLAWPASTRACAPAPMDGDHVMIESEDAIIIWDEAAGVEHFIRRANFDTTAKDFGFIVPTPTAPKLHEFDDAVFAQLRGITQRDVEVRKEYDPEAISLCLSPFLMVAGDDAKSAPVDVLSRQRVAGFDAVVLDAKDGGALTTWLGDNGYAKTPHLAAWAQHYIDEGWVFTAFKMAAEEGHGLSTSAVRMTFATERPFYPYREPESDGPRPPARALRVFFIAPGRHEGELDGGGVWPGETLYARPLSEPLQSDAGLVPDGAWMTEFLDHANPRPVGADVIFRGLANGAELRHTRIRKTSIPIPVDAILLIVLAGVFIWRRRNPKGGVRQRGG